LFRSLMNGLFTRGFHPLWPSPGGCSIDVLVFVVYRSIGRNDRKRRLFGKLRKTRKRREIDKCEKPLREMFCLLLTSTSNLLVGKWTQRSAYFDLSVKYKHVLPQSLLVMPRSSSSSSSPEGTGVAEPNGFPNTPSPPSTPGTPSWGGASS